MSKIDVLGVKIDDISLSQALGLVKKWTGGSGKHYIVTPNPEMLVAAQKDPEFKDVLNKADLAIPDGVGLKFAGVKNTVSGVDLMEALIKLSAENGLTIGFLGGGERIAERLSECLRGIYQSISVVFASSGGRVNREGEVEGAVELKIPPCDILFVAFGHGKQEKWIRKNLSKYPVKVMMGVGGSIDYLSGRVPRAPKWIRSIGFEWLFRLIRQPRRIKRQLSLIKYIWLLQQAK